MEFAAIFFCLGVMLLIIGVIVALSPKKTPTNAATFQPPAPRPVAQVIKPVAPVPPVAQAAPPVPSAAAKTPDLNWVKVGDRISVPHPAAGTLTVFVSAKATYQELWQTQRGPQAPWVPTGNNFTGFWLETNRFLLAWQNRCYILDEGVPISDADIQRDLAPYAKQFAQSNQTAEVLFAYPPASWKMDDIGKFRISALEGSGLNASLGGVGRFIHASGSDNRALVVEDYEGGSGQDMAWNGYLIELSEIKPVAA